MKLRVIDGNVDVGELGVYTLSMEQFCMKEYHPFIAANEWDEVRIDLTENTPIGIIRQIVKSYRIIPQFDKENITLRIMKLLCEICVDEAAKLRTLYASDMETFKDFVQELGDKRNWWGGD